MANIQDARTIRKLEEQKRWESFWAEHKHCIRDLERSSKVRTGDVIRCKHGSIYLVVAYRQYASNSVRVLARHRNPFLYRKAIRSLRLEEELARREAAAGVPEPEGEGA